MNYYRFSYHLTDREPICEKDSNCVTVIFKERRHISSMERVSAVSVIEMSPGIGKRVLRIARTGLAGVNVKSEDLLSAPVCAMRQPANIGIHKHAVFGGIEHDNTPYIGIFFASRQHRRGHWPSLYYRKISTVCSVHIIIPPEALYSCQQKDVRSRAIWLTRAKPLYI